MKFRIEIEKHGGTSCIFLYSQFHNHIQWSGMQLQEVESLKELKKVIEKKLKELESE